MVSRAAVQQQAIPTAQQQVLPAIQQQILPTTQQQAIPMVQQQSQPATQQQVMPTTQHRILPPTQQQVTPTVQQQTLPPIQQQVIPTVQPRQTPVPVPIPMLAPTPIPTPVHNNNIAFNAPPTALTTKTEPQPDPITEGPVLFREGEVVWYKNNNAWRIGLVLELVVADGTPNSQSTCFVKPLAHSALQLETVLKIEADMRPFLAFSVPPGMLPKCPTSFIMQ